MVTYAKISPKMANPRDKAGKAEEEDVVMPGSQQGSHQSSNAEVTCMAPPAKSLHSSRVPDQNGVSLLYIMFEIHHSGREPSI